MRIPKRASVEDCWLLAIAVFLATVLAGCGRNDSPQLKEHDGLTRSQTYFISVSPDGTRVAFDLSVPKGQATPPEGLYVVSLSTGQAYCLVRASRDPYVRVLMLQWLPGSNGLVYTALSGGVFSIKHKSLDKRPPLSLMDSREEAFYYPLPSPDGRWVAYWSQPLGQGSMQLAVATADGSQNSVVADLQSDPSFLGLMQWDADSSRLYFLAGDSQAETLSLQFAELVDGRFAVGSPEVYRSPDLSGFKVSPDGKQLLLTLFQSGHIKLAVAQLSEPTSHVVIEDEATNIEVAAQWAPDGKSLCYLRPRSKNRELVAVSWPSGQKTVLASNVRELPWTGAWTPQGLIVFRRDGNEIWTVRSDGTNEKLVFSADSRINP